MNESTTVMVGLDVHARSVRLAAVRAVSAFRAVDERLGRPLVVGCNKRFPAGPEEPNSRVVRRCAFSVPVVEEV
jgi:hypothetical protein